MTTEEAISYWEEFNAEIDDLYEVYCDDVLLRQREVVEFTIAAIRAQQEWEKNEPLNPCDLCAYNPPSSIDGKPCCMCPAVGK